MKKKKEKFYLCTCNRLTQVNDDVLARELEKKFNLKTGLLEYEKKIKTFYNKLFDITLSDEQKEILKKYHEARGKIMSRYEVVEVLDWVKYKWNSKDKRKIHCGIYFNVYMKEK